MKKRLLFAFMAMCVAVSGYALTKGEYVYTPQGRFLITSDVLEGSTFQDWTGWTVKSAGKTLAEKFNTNANGYAAGLNSVVCVDDPTDDNNKTEGMYYTFQPTSADATYIVSFKLKGGPSYVDVVKTFIPGDGYQTPTNLVKVAGNPAGTYTYPEAADEVIVNTWEELTEEWQTFNYAIVGDGTARTWFISFMTMSTTVEIADLQIAQAQQYADLRQRDAVLEKLNAYKNCYNWPAEVWTQFDGYPEVVAGLEAIGDESGQAELDELVAVADEVLAEFLYEKMDDYLDGNNDNYLGIKQTDGNTQKVSNYGDWTCLPTGRAFWNSGAYPDLGHFGGNNAWAYSNPDSPMGVYTQMTFDPGSYVFTIESLSALRADPTSTSWTLNEGWNPAYGVAYVVKMVDGAAADTIVSVVKGLDSRVYTPFVVVIPITEAGTYEIGFKAYCKEEYKTKTNGSVVYVKDARLYGKNDNKYNQKQLRYWKNVTTQITTGRENLTTAAGYLANESYLWGKDALKAVADEVEPKIAGYEAMSQDDIIATFDRDTYVNTTSEETGLLQYQVYQEATKLIIAANREFIAENDTLASMQTVIDNAEKTIGMRLYDSATGKDALQAAIDKAKGIQAQMKASQYSEENAATIVAANAELNEAVNVFTTTIPANCIASIVDIDFEKEAELDIESFLYTISGAKGSMELSSYVEGAEATNQEFQKGYWTNGEQLWKGYLRVGNGEGTVVFDPTENGSMGTNILKVACDFYVQGLAGKSLGFYLKDAEDTDVFGIFHNFYNGTNTTNTCEANLDYIWAKSGGSYANASPADATDSITNNPLEKTHFEVIMDYGRKSIYCTINSVNGSTTSNEFVLEAVPTKFVLKCDYNNNDRRAWFDNLKIDRITAGATDPFDPTAIENVKAVIKVKNGAIYNLAGQRVGENYKGVVVKDGKKMIQR